MSERLRIVHVATFVHPDRLGGAERVVADLAAGQAELGHEVTVISCAAPGAPARERRRGFTHVREVLAPKLRGIRFFSAVRGATRAAVRALPAFDVLHTHQIASAGAAFAVAPRGVTRVHSFYAPYANESAVERGDSWMQRLRANLANRMDKSVLAAADAVIALSRFSVDQVAALGPALRSPVHVVHPGVDTHRFRMGDRAAARERLGVPADATLVVSVRRLVKRMGLDVGIDAFARCVNDGIDARYWIAGDGPERERLEDHVDGLGMMGRIALVGHVDEDPLPDVLRAADVFLLPTRALEGFGMATLEALACGTPVVATDAGATPEVLARLAPAFRPVACSVESLGAALTNCLRDLDNARAIARDAAERIAREHTLPAAAQRVVDVYAEARAGARR